MLIKNDDIAFEVEHFQDDFDEFEVGIENIFRVLFAAVVF